MALSLIKGSKKTGEFVFLTPAARQVCSFKMIKSGNKLVNEAIVLDVYFLDLGNAMVATMKVMVCLYFIVINKCFFVYVSDPW